MYPVDGSEPEGFDGVDFAAFYLGPPIYNGLALSSRVLDSLEGFFAQKGIPARRCNVAGMGAASGGPPFYDLVVWVSEHWEFLSGFVTATAISLGKIRERVAGLLRKFAERTPEQAEARSVVDLAVRKVGTGGEADVKLCTSYQALLELCPEIHSRLQDEFDQRFEIRVLRIDTGVGTVYARFKVSDLTRADAAKMMRFMDRHRFHDGPAVAVLYRSRLGMTRIKASRERREFGRLVMR